MSGIKNEINLDFKSKCLKRIPATTTSVDIKETEHDEPNRSQNYPQLSTFEVVPDLP